MRLRLKTDTRMGQDLCLRTNAWLYQQRGGENIPQAAFKARLKM